VLVLLGFFGFWVGFFIEFLRLNVLLFRSLLDGVREVFVFELVLGLNFEDIEVVLVDRGL
jgi:hypothetical protein